MNEVLRAAIYGFAVGDALGVPVEFKPRGSFYVTGMEGYGSHHQPAGTWSDDTSMTLATCDSIRELGYIDCGDLYERFHDWLYNANYTVDYIGKLDNNQERSVGIYQRKTSGSPIAAIGGWQNKKYYVKQVSVLIHWTKNARETEDASFSLFEKLLNISDLTVGQTHINYVRLMVPEPQDVGTDDAGVYERVIWLDLYYER